MHVLHGLYCYFWNFGRIANLKKSYNINSIINIKYSFNNIEGTESRPRLAAYNITRIYGMNKYFIK